MRLDPWRRPTVAWFLTRNHARWREPFGYDYEQILYVSLESYAGRYTREGDVRELLLKSDMLRHLATRR